MKAYFKNEDAASILVNELDRMLNSINRKIIPVRDMRSSRELLFMSFELFAIKSQMISQMIKNEKLPENIGVDTIHQDMRRTAAILFLMQSDATNIDDLDDSDLNRVDAMEDYLLRQFLDLIQDINKIVK